MNYRIRKMYIYLSNAWNRRDKHVWVFGEWFGKRCGDNACYLANYVAQEHPEIKVYWICDQNTDTSLLSSNITVIDRNSRGAVKVLRKAKVAVMIQGINDFFDDGRNYLGNALKVNLWHGVMWKKIGYDIEPGLTQIGKVIALLKNSINRHYMFTAPNEEYKRIIKRAFMLKDEEIINAGYPRNMVFYSESLIKECKMKIVKILEKKGLDINPDTKIITYMPTFRDKTFEVFSFGNVANEPKLTALLNDINAVIVEKSHLVREKTNGINSSRICSIENICATELLAGTDVLITDYSSCFFDYLLLNRPIIHYLYDYKYYMNNDRGVYYKKEEIACGATPENYDDLLSAINDAILNPYEYEILRNKKKESAWQYDSKETCRVITERILDRIY